MARSIALLAGLPKDARTNCESLLFFRTTNNRNSTNEIMSEQADVLVAGGVELMSAVPMGGNEPTNNPELQEQDTVFLIRWD